MINRRTTARRNKQKRQKLFEVFAISFVVVALSTALCAMAIVQYYTLASL